MMPRTRFLPRAAASVVILAASLAGLHFATDARASVSLAATWDGLLHESTAAAVVSYVEARPVWEDGRIYTYTHVRVDRAVAGELAQGGDTWVRTMGGIVGKVGQIVEGEAAFAPGETSLLFLRRGPVGAYVVTGRGQGQFPIVNEDPQVPQKVVRSHIAGMIIPRRPTTAGPARLAVDVMQDRPIDDVARDIATAWVAAHAR
jgi:hypothetical protein